MVFNDIRMFSALFSILFKKIGGPLLGFSQLWLKLLAFFKLQLSQNVQ